MAASYPTSTFAPSTKTAGATVSESHINSLQDEVVAIEAALRTSLAHDLLFTDATYDIGKTGATRPRDGFFSRNMTIGGTAYIGDTSNADVTLGLTLNQGASTNSIMAFKSSSVAHGITSVVETDSYGGILKADSGEGGVYLRGFSEGKQGVRLTGNVTTAETGARSTASLGAVIIDGALKAAAALGNLGADANILVVRDAATARFVLDADGDSHQDVGTAWTNFDSHDDVMVLDSLASEVSKRGDPWKAKIRRQMADSLGAGLTRKQMEAMKLVTFNKDGHHFVNMSKLTMLHTGALRQIGRQLQKTERRIAKLERKRLTA